MSNSVFPLSGSTPGLSWNRLKNPLFSTKTQHATSGKQTRVSYMLYPLWQFTLSYELLRDVAGAYDELNAIRDFFLQMRGAYDSFLYFDPEDNSVSNIGFGVGDGMATSFQLTRPIKAGGFIEPIQNLNGNPSIYEDTGTGPVLKVPGTDYTVSALGVVTFTTPPVLGAALTWSGNYYYRCHFLNDSAEFNEFMYRMWELKKIDFESVKL